MSRNENRASMTKGESSHGKHPAESVKGIEGNNTNHAGSPGGTGVRFKMPKDSECTDHSRVRDLD
jgi:hypothetical protein